MRTHSPHPRRYFRRLGLPAAIIAAMILAATTATAIIRGIENRDLSWASEQIASFEIVTDGLVAPNGAYFIIRNGHEATAYSFADHEELWTSTDPLLASADLLISPDGNRIASRRHFALFDGLSGERIRTSGQEDARWHRLLAFNADGSLLAHDTGPGLVVEETDTGGVLLSVAKEDFTSRTTTLRASFEEPGGPLLVYTQPWATLHRFDPANGSREALSTFPIHADDAPVAFHHSSGLVAVESIGLGILVFDMETGEQVAFLEEERHLRFLDFADDGATLLVCLGGPEDSTATIMRLDIATGEPQETIERDQWQIAGVYTEDGEHRFAEWTRDGLHFFAADGTPSAEPFLRQRSPIVRAIPSDNDNRTLLLDNTRHYAIMEMESGQVGPWHRFPYGFSYYSLHIARTGTTAILQVEKDVISWDLMKGEPEATLGRIGDLEWADLALSRDGSVAAIARRGTTEVDFHDPETGDLLRTIPFPERFFSFGLSPDAGLAAFFCEEGIVIVDAAGGGELLRLYYWTIVNWNDPNRPPPDYPYPDPFWHPNFDRPIPFWPTAKLVFSPDNAQLSVYTKDYGLAVVDIVEGTLREYYTDWYSDYNYLASEFIFLDFSPDGARLLHSPRWLDRPLGWGNSRSGAVLLDLRSGHATREFFIAPDDFVYDPEVHSHHYLTPLRAREARFSLDGSRILSIAKEASSVHVHHSGIAGDNRVIALENILGRETDVPPTARGVDTSGDGTLDAGDVQWSTLGME